MSNVAQRKRHAAEQREYFSSHREACLARMRRYNKEHRKERSAYSRALHYGMTLEDYEARLKSQNYACAACGGELLKPHVDHDHACCGKVKRTCGDCTRGILCERCNLGLGNFSDSIALLRKAILYLQRWERKREWQ